jgi:hypothetical protein
MQLLSRYCESALHAFTFDFDTHHRNRWIYFSESVQKLYCGDRGCSISEVDHHWIGFAKNWQTGDVSINPSKSIWVGGATRNRSDWFLGSHGI